MKKNIGLIVVILASATVLAFFQNCAGNYNPSAYNAQSSVQPSPSPSPSNLDCTVAANTSWTDSTGKISCSISKATTITNGQSKTITADSTNSGSVGYLCSNGTASVVTASNNCAVPFIAAPTITTQPVVALTVKVGMPINLSVVATGSGLTYMWSKTVNGVKTDIANSNSPNFTIASAVVANSGTYTVTIINGSGSVTSSGAVVTVELPATWQSVAINGSVPSGATIVYDPTCDIKTNGTDSNVRYYGATNPPLVGTGCTVAGAYCYDQLLVGGNFSATWNLLICK